MPFQNYYSVAETAYELGCTETRVRQMLIAKEMSGEKVSRIWMIPKREVRRVSQMERRKGGRPRIGDK